MVNRSPKTFAVPWPQTFDLKEKTQTHSYNKYMPHAQRRHSPRADGPSQTALQAMSPSAFKADRHFNCTYE